ncbi:MAG: chemotaxis protein CheV [Gammaproteobacteria bacterium]
MGGVLESVNKRTQLVGQNRLELLLFQLNTKQKYGINVFKVKEVIRCLPLTLIPKRNPVVRGVAHIRGLTIPVIDMNMAIGGDPITNAEKSFIIITEYNQAIQGFLVQMVEKIVNMRWEAIRPPPAGIGGQRSYLTAVTQVDDALVEIIDVEKILQEISPARMELVKTEETEKAKANLKDRFILVVDDSSVARNQIKHTLEEVGVQVRLKKNGREGLEYLKELADQPEELSKLLLVISDVEMPEMDGYTLTTEVRSDPRLKDLYVVLHTSLSGVFNSALVEKVGANKFLPKFKATSLADSVLEYFAKISQ